MYPQIEATFAGKKHKLTLGQVKFIREYIKTGNATRSAMVAFKLKSEDVAGSRGSQVLGNVRIHDIVRQVFEAKGLTLPFLVNELKHQVKATRLHSSPTEPDREVPDNQSRIRAIEVSGRWLGLDKQQIADIPGNTENKTLNITYNNWGKE